MLMFDRPYIIIFHLCYRENDIEDTSSESHHITAGNVSTNNTTNQENEISRCSLIC